MRMAITRAVSEALARCELTHVVRAPIDLERARAQHAAYEARLAALGCEVVRLPAEPTMPDAVFVEDAAVVLAEVGIVARPGAAPRRAEIYTIAPALEPYRTLVEIQPPATLDGGDVLVVDRMIFVGRSTRTNDAGRAQLTGAVAPFGYDVRPVNVRGCLHLKSAVTDVGAGRLLLNRDWVDAGAFGDFELVDVDPAEPFAANALRVGDTVIHPEPFARTRARLEQRGVRVEPVDLSELAKAEGGVTCCSLIFDPVARAESRRAP